MRWLIYRGHKKVSQQMMKRRCFSSSDTKKYMKVCCAASLPSDRKKDLNSAYEFFMRKLIVFVYEILVCQTATHLSLQTPIQKSWDTVWKINKTEYDNLTTLFDSRLSLIWLEKNVSKKSGNKKNGKAVEFSKNTCLDKTPGQRWKDWLVIRDVTVSKTRNNMRYLLRYLNVF